MMVTTFTEDAATGCWIWSGRVHQRYGQASHGRVAHRLVYEQRRGPIPEGMELDHTCRNTLCVNPDHLEPVTRAENVRRRYADYDHCASGHPYTPENTYRRPSGHRDCRVCIREGVHRYQKRKASA